MKTRSRMFPLGALAAAVAMLPAAPVLADNAVTGGGIKVVSDDGRFEGNLGGRIQYDYATIARDQLAPSTANGAYLRRAYVSLSGKLFGDLRYKLENDFSNAGSSANKDIWIGLELPAKAGLLRIGHMQPPAGMESQTSSNELLFTERPFISSNTMFSGREYQNAISYNAHASGFTAAAAAYDANATSGGDKDASKPAGGRGLAGRITYAPFSGSGAVLHVGLSYDNTSFRLGTPNAGASGGAAVNAQDVGKISPKVAIVAAGYETDKTLTGELAGGFGPAFVQAEYASGRFAGGTLATEETVTSCYVQGSVFVTGESKLYRQEFGVFGSPRPHHPWGAVELKARYDHVRNRDAASQPEVSTVSLGANYYLNPNVRVMLDYNIGKSETTAAGLTTTDKPKSFVARFQLVF